MEYLSEKAAPLIGGLIGLARATDGNEHLICASSTAVVMEGLAAAASGNVPDGMLDRVEEEKRKMVPDCFRCAAPCGRNNAYDLSRLENAPEEVRRLKERILGAIAQIAVDRKEAYDAAILYKGLIVIGMEELPVETLLAIAQEAEAVSDSQP